jgi:hypothetical protein
MQKGLQHHEENHVPRTVYYNASSLLRVLSFVGLKARHAERIVTETLQNLQNMCASVHHQNIQLHRRPGCTIAVELSWCAFYQ